MATQLHDHPPRLNGGRALRAIDVTSGPRLVLTQVADLARELTGARHAAVVPAREAVRRTSVKPERGVVSMPLRDGQGGRLGVLRVWDKPGGLTRSDRTIVTVLARLASDLVDAALAYGRATRSSARFRAMVRGAPLPIVEMDDEGRCLVWNRAAERFFGWTAEDVRGTVCPAVPERLRPELRSILRRVFAGETVGVVETLRERRDGSLVDVCVFIAPVLADSGAVLGAMAIISDRSERSLLQRQLDQLRAGTLSPRERDVVRLLRKGTSYRDIAKALGRSEGTVRTLVHRAYRKLDVHSRGDLPTLA